MTQQLLLDVYAGDRYRPVSAARIAERLHQRGWITLPHDTTVPAGTVIAAWVCCHCGGAETSAYRLHISHGCCAVAVPSCTRPGRHGRFDQCWTPRHPGRAA